MPPVCQPPRRFFLRFAQILRAKCVNTHNVFGKTAQKRLCAFICAKPYAFYSLFHADREFADDDLLVRLARDIDFDAGDEHPAVFDVLRGDAEL